MLELLCYLRDLIYRTFAAPACGTDDRTPGQPVATIIIPEAVVTTPGLKDTERKAGTLEVLLLHPPFTSSEGQLVRPPTSTVVVQLHEARGAGIFHIRSGISLPIANNALAHRGLRMRPVGALDYAIWMSQAYDALEQALAHWHAALPERKEKFATHGFIPGDPETTETTITNWINERLPPHLAPPPEHLVPAPLQWQPGATTTQVLSYVAALPGGERLKIDTRRPGQWQWAHLTQSKVGKRLTKADRLNQPDQAHYRFASPEEAQAAAQQHAVAQGWLPQVPAPVVRLAYLPSSNFSLAPRGGVVVPLVPEAGHELGWEPGGGTPVVVHPHGDQAVGYVVPAPPMGAWASPNDLHIGTALGAPTPLDPYTLPVRLTERPLGALPLHLVPPPVPLMDTARASGAETIRHLLPRGGVREVPSSGPEQPPEGDWTPLVPLQEHLPLGQGEG